MSINAKKKFHFPHNNSSGRRMNSRIFIVPITIICSIEFKRESLPLKIHIAMAVSARPMAIVCSRLDCFPSMVATICSCLGTRLNTLQNSPLISQMEPISICRKRYRKILFNKDLCSLWRIYIFIFLWKIGMM